MSTRFVPIRGTEESIRNLNIENGHIYFAFDTGHVYLDKDSETRIAISGRGSSVYLFDDINPSTNYNGYYVFPVNKMLYPEFSADTIKEEDIIINIASGEMFRVLYFDTRNINNKEIKCAISDKIVLAGSGSGGEQPGELNQISLELTSNIPYHFVYGREAYATFISTAVGSTDINIKLTVIGADGSTHERTKMVQSGEEFEIEYGTLLFLGDNTILISANGDNVVNSGTIEKRYRQREATNLELRRPDGNIIYQYQSGDKIAFSYVPIGAVEKYVELYIDDRLVYTSNPIPSNVSGVTQSIEITQEMITAEGATLSGYHEIILRLKAADEDNDNEIEAEPLSYELAWVDDTTSAPIIWFPNGIPTDIIQYSSYNLEYMVFDVSKTKQIKTFLFKGEDTTGTELDLDYVPGEPHIWVLSELDIGTNEFRIKSGNTERRFSINCIPLTERDLGIIKDGLILDLDAAGRSNNESIEKRYSWPRGNKDNGIKFNNFNWYNNGWITDKDGITCLRISNGASISIPFTKLNSEQLEKNLALEFRFKIKNVKEYITLTTRGQSEDDENTILTLETENSVCGRFFGPQKGLLIGTQEAVFTYGPTLSVRYKEDEVIDLFLVFDASNKLIYMYLNGILTAAQHYNSYANLNTKATAIEFNSKYCDLDLYSIRAYETDTAFSSENVVHNFVANLSGEARLNAYDTNQIVSYNEETKEPYIDYYKMIQYNAAHPDTPLMPYAVVKSLSSDDLLPYRKGDEKPVEITFVNPYLDYLWENRDTIDQNQHPVINAHKYLTSCPSFHFRSTKNNFNVQGTSSQGYPRRNFKLKTKLGSNVETDYWVYTNGPLQGANISEKITYNDIKYKNWYMDSDLPANKFCWKADYMESSGSYNTGFANFASILYEHHPLYNIFKDSAYDKYRTSVYGFPMLVFQEKQEKADDGKTQYEFVGKYNFNLDKSSNSRYGFELKEEQPYLEGHPLIADIAECWEFTNNQGTYCAFRTPWPNENASFAPIASDSFEYRYNVDEDGLDSIKFTGVEADDRNPVASDGLKKPVREYFKNFKVLYDWLYNVGKIESSEDRKQAFKAGFEKHLNKEYCFIYFILTELLHCYDSRGKNLMMATWGPEEENGEYIWYPIFYDVDTQLGLNNSGEQLWDYYAEPTDNNDFSTSNSVLWNCLWECYSTEIKEKYNSIRTAEKISLENLDGYYNFNPSYTNSLAMKGQRPLSIYNIDEYYKYIAPSLTGFISTTGQIANDSFGHIYCLQGTRELSRTLYLRNRINYLDSKWLGGAYAYTSVNGGGFETRLNANYGRTSDKYIVSDVPVAGYIQQEDSEWPNALDADPTFTVRPFLRQYVSVYYDRSATDPISSDTTAGNYVYNKVEKEYFLTDDITFEEGKTYYYFEDNNYYKINDFDGNFFTPIDATNLNYTNYYIKDENDEYISATGTDYNSEETYYYRNVWERSYRVTAENFRDFYIKDGNNYIQPAKYDESISFDENVDYYELVELISGEPIEASNANLITITPSSDILNAYKTTADHTQQLAYVTGAEYISDLGDLSNKYFNQFNIGGAYRLENLTLGSDAIIGDNIYRNEVLTNILLATSKNDLHPKTLLKKVVLNGLTKFNSFLDLTGCEKLEEFRALRTALPQVAFADGVQLKTLHLPNSINTLSLKEANKLTKVISEANDRENKPNEGLYIEGLTNVADIPNTTNIIKISIEGDHLGYDSYKLLDKLVAIKKKMKQAGSSIDSDLAIGMRKVNWSPYILIPYGTEFDENETYYLDSGRFTIEELSGDKLETIKANWNQYLGNSLIFAKQDSDYQVDYPITSLALLDTFIQDISGKTKKAETQFSNDDPYEDQISLPDITGILYVYNSIGLKETDLVKYKQYFPELRIFCENVIPGTKITYMYYKNIMPEDENDKNIIEWTEAARFEDSNIVINRENPFSVMEEEHYTFNGWRIYDPLTFSIGEFISDAEGAPANGNSIAINTGEEYIVIADFSKEIYNITFYYERGIDGTPTKSFVQRLEYNEDIEFPDITKYYPWYDDSSNDLMYNESYQFIGYDKNPDSTTASFAENRLSLPIAISDTTYYAIFKKVKVDKNILDERFLIYDSFNDSIYLDPEYKDILKGKITIPTKIRKDVTDRQKKNYSSFGKTIRDLSDGEANYEEARQVAFNKITHIFWASDINNTQFTRINNYCFSCWQNLKYIELPDSNSVVELGDYAFSAGEDAELAQLFKNYGKINIQNSTQQTQFALNQFFANITSFGMKCFASVWNDDNSTRWKDCYIYLNPNLIEMGRSVFYNNRLVFGSIDAQLGGICFGSAEHPLNSDFIKKVNSLPAESCPILSNNYSQFDNDKLFIHRIYYYKDIDSETLQNFILRLGNVICEEGGIIGI